jgi:hypothetical protein
MLVFEVNPDDAARPPWRRRRRTTVRAASPIPLALSSCRPAPEETRTSSRSHLLPARTAGVIEGKRRHLGRCSATSRRSPASAWRLRGESSCAVRETTAATRSIWALTRRPWRPGTGYRRKVSPEPRVRRGGRPDVENRLVGIGQAAGLLRRDVAQLGLGRERDQWHPLWMSAGC